MTIKVALLRVVRETKTAMLLLEQIPDYRLQFEAGPQGCR